MTMTTGGNGTVTKTRREPRKKKKGRSKYLLIDREVVSRILQELGNTLKTRDEKQTVRTALLRGTDIPQGIWERMKREKPDVVKEINSRQDIR